MPPCPNWTPTAGVGFYLLIYLFCQSGRGGFLSRFYLFVFNSERNVLGTVHIVHGAAPAIDRPMI